jgi:hemoglobin
MMTMQEMTLYEAIGGLETIKSLTARFYLLMDTLPEAARCRAVHPADMSGSEQKLTEYLSGWLGGPPLYTDKYGHPRLRSRHFGAAIGTAEIDEWLLCFHRAMEETISDAYLRAAIWEPVEKLAHHMRNKDA